MASSDPFNVGTSGLLSSQQSLATVSHNVSNVNTEGYSRQEAMISSRKPSHTGAGYVGNGAHVTNVRRLADDFLTQQLERRTSDAEYQDTLHTYASRLDNLLADPDAGLNPALESFFKANQGVADDPSSISARQVLMTETESLMKRFNTMHSRLGSLEEQVNTEMRDSLAEVNSLAEEIASLNYQIANSEGTAAGRQPNDLLDQREKLIKDLSEHIEVRTTKQDNGSVNVYIGKGQSLVSNFDARGLETVTSPYDSSRIEIGYRQGDRVVNVSNLINGGHLGALKDYRDDILDPAVNELGRVAYGLAEHYNEQHRKGMDLNSEVGGDFFDIGHEQVRPSVHNSQNAPEVGYEIVDTSQLEIRDYRLLAQSDGTYNLVDARTDKLVAGDIDPGGDEPQVEVEGIAISIGSGEVKAGDSYLIQPNRAGARTVRMHEEMNDPAKIAAAGPVVTNTDRNNRGDAQLNDLRINSTRGQPDGGGAFANPQRLEPPLEIRFSDDPNQPYAFRVNHAETGEELASGEYDPAEGLDVIDFLEDQEVVGPDHGYSVRLTGDPGLGDRFTVGYSNEGVGDNSNMLELAGLQTRKTMLNEGADFQETYAGVVTHVGTQTHQADIARDAQQALLRQAREARQDVSGVNLDEEAADMMKFQQSYQASAQVISAAQSMFQELIGAVRG